MSFIEIIFSQLKRWANEPVLIEIRGEQCVSVTGAELIRWQRQVRRYLEHHGVSSGDRVALLAPNSARWVACDLALLAHGAISVPLYARQDPHELAQMLGDCAPRVLIVANDELFQAIDSAWPVGDRGDCVLAHYDTVFGGDVSDSAPSAVSEAQIVTMVYTSGTSGEPKGVMVTRANVDFMLPTTASAINKITGAQQRVDQVFHFLPLCFAGSRIMLWTQLYRGNPLMLSTDLNNLVQEMGTANPNYYLNVPAVLERIRRGVNAKLAERGGFIHALYQAGVAAGLRIARDQGGLRDRLMQLLATPVFKKIKGQIGSRLEFLICGSAPLAEDTQRWFNLIGVPVYQVYGLTETTAIVTMDTKETVEPGKVGLAIDGVEMALSDEGELLCRGPNIFPGYWNKPEHTQDAVRDGWFQTGDQAEIDDHGNLRIIGRVKHLLVLESGHNVAPEPIEQQLLERCPAIEQAMLVGHGRPFLSVIATGAVTESQIEAALEALNAQLPHYRRVRKVYRTDELFSPENGLLTANQKMRRRVIEAHFAGAIEELYR